MRGYPGRFEFETASARCAGAMEGAGGDVGSGVSGQAGKGEMPCNAVAEQSVAAFFVGMEQEDDGYHVV